MSNFERARTVMVDNQLRPAGINDRVLLSAMGRIPREKFVPAGRSAIAYTDAAHPLSAGRQLTAPATFARLLQSAGITQDDFVLDVGCGTGYSTAIIAELASAVVGLDEEAALVDAANANLAALDIGNATVVKGDIADGLAPEAPFDAIIVEGAVDYVPPALLKQLRDGGRLVAMISEGVTATANVFVKTGDEITSLATFNACMPHLLAVQPEPVFSL